MGRPRVLSLDEVAESVSNGKAVVDIARDFGVTPRAVQHAIVALGFRPAPPPQLTADVLLRVVTEEVRRHGPKYGVPMLLGALRARFSGWCFPRRAVQRAMQAAHPDAYEARRLWTQHKIVRRRYHAPYSMYSCHLDLACKLQEYGLFIGAPSARTPSAALVLALRSHLRSPPSLSAHRFALPAAPARPSGALLDGKSRLVLSLRAITNKLPLTIYKEVRFA